MHLLTFLLYSILSDVIDCTGFYDFVVDSMDSMDSMLDFEHLASWYISSYFPFISTHACVSPLDTERVQRRPLRDVLAERVTLDSTLHSK